MHWQPTNCRRGNICNILADIITAKNCNDSINYSFYVGVIVKTYLW